MTTPIILNVDDLRERAMRLRLIKTEYEDCQLKLNQTLNQLADVYKLKGEPVVVEELNLTATMNKMIEKLNYLADLLENRATEIENENYD